MGGMVGKRTSQQGLAEADHPYLESVEQDSSNSFLGGQRDQLFRAEDLAALYCRNEGLASVQPSLLATALLQQTYGGVSDEQVKARADFDLRWKVALGIGLEDRPFAKITLQLFRRLLAATVTNLTLIAAKELHAEVTRFGLRRRST